MSQAIGLSHAVIDRLGQVVGEGEGLVQAALRGEAAADVDDVKALVVPVLRHRLVMSYRAEAEGVRDTDVLQAVLQSVR